MGQEIAALLTNQPVELAKEIVHFKGNRIKNILTIVPLDIDMHGIIDFLMEARKFKQVPDLIAYLKTDEEKLEKGSNCLHSLVTIIELIETYQLHSFALEYYMEVGDYPAVNLFFECINNEIMHKSIFLDGYEEEDEEEEKYRYSIAGYLPNWVADESTFFSYSKAAEKYVGSV